MKYNTLPTLVARSIINAIIALFNTFDTMPDNDALCDYIVAIISRVARETRFPLPSGSHDSKRAIALALSTAHKAALSRKLISVQQYIELYATEKECMYYEMRDYGAAGDLIEVLTRVACLPSITLTHAAHLYVKPENTSDITIKGVKFEVAHNGKTWTFGTIDNPLYGDFTGVVYGVWDAELLKQLFFDAEVDIPRALATIREYMCVWGDKDAFRRDMDSLFPRGKFFTIKSCKVMNNCGDGFMRRFNEAVEDGRFTTLKDFLSK